MPMLPFISRLVAGVTFTLEENRAGIVFCFLLSYNMSIRCNNELHVKIIKISYENVEYNINPHFMCSHPSLLLTWIGQFEHLCHFFLLAYSKNLSSRYCSFLPRFKF